MDYAALAKKYGGSQQVNYANIAQKYGGASTAPSVVSQEEQTNPVRNAVTKTADFLGITKLGQGIATAFRTAAGSTNTTGNQEGDLLRQTQKLIDEARKKPVGSPERTRLLAQAKNLGAAVPQAEIDPGTTLTNKEVLGSAANTALNVASAGLGAPKGSTFLAKAANAVQQGTLLGAGFGAAQAATDNASAEDIFKSSAVGAVTGAAFGVGVEGLSAIGRFVTSKPVTENIINRNLGVSKALVEQGRSPAKKILSEGIIGTKAGIAKQAVKEANTLQKAVQAVVDSKPYQIESNAILGRIKQELADTYRFALGSDDINKIINKLPVELLRSEGQVDTSQLNKLRSLIDTKYLGDRNWLRMASATEPERISALKIASNVMREVVQGTDERLPGLFSRYADAINLFKTADKELLKHHILTNLIEMAGSGLLGSITGKDAKGDILSSGLFYALIKTALSTPASTAAAVSLNRVGALGASNSLASQLTRKTGRLGIMNSTKEISKPTASQMADPNNQNQ